MKKMGLYCIILGASSLLGLSCTKTLEYIDQYPAEIEKGLTTNQERKVRFLLYTDQSFSENEKMITFTMVIRDAHHKVLWDSVLSPMRIKDIPARLNKLEVVKSVPDNNRSLLQVGFLYFIENVGYSWYLDAFKEGESEKVIDYNFH